MVLTKNVKFQLWKISINFARENLFTQCIAVLSSLAAAGCKNDATAALDAADACAANLGAAGMIWEISF